MYFIRQEGSQGYEKEKEIEKNCKEMRLICAKGRSEKAKRQLKIDFKKGIKVCLDFKS